MAEQTYLEAARDALAEEMRRDETVWALGEDLGRVVVVPEEARALEASDVL